jgi:hypothetical protein
METRHRVCLKECYGTFISIPNESRLYTHVLRAIDHALIMSQLQLPRGSCAPLSRPFHLNNHPNLRANSDQLTLLIPNLTAQIKPPITKTLHSEPREQPLDTFPRQILLDFNPHIERWIESRSRPLRMFRWWALFCPLD